MPVAIWRWSARPCAAEAGAALLDINVGPPGADQTALMVAAFRAQEVTGHCFAWPAPTPPFLPGWRYDGFLSTSVTGESTLEAVLLSSRLWRRRDALPWTIAAFPKPPRPGCGGERILARAVALGIPREHVIVDPLTMAVGADTGAGRVTLETIRLVRQELDVNITLGVSNVSHGLPLRPALNATFVAMAIALGATCPIANPLDAHMMETIRAANRAWGDEWAAAGSAFHAAASRRQ